MYLITFVVFSCKLNNLPYQCGKCWLAVELWFPMKLTILGIRKYVKLAPVAVCGHSEAKSLEQCSKVKCHLTFDHCSKLLASLCPHTATGASMLSLITLLIE